MRARADSSSHPQRWASTRHVAAVAAAAAAAAAAAFVLVVLALALASGHEVMVAIVGGSMTPEPCRTCSRVTLVLHVCTKDSEALEIVLYGRSRCQCPPRSSHQLHVPFT